MSDAPGERVLIVNWRDQAHSRAGGAEVFCDAVARRWATSADVTLLCAAVRGHPPIEHVNGYRVVRAGSAIGVYGRALWHMATSRDDYDAILDCQNGMPFMSPVALPRVPVVRLVFHVHQDQFTRQLPRPVAGVARVAERAMETLYARRQVAVLGESTRVEMRRRLRSRAPIDPVGVGVTPMEMPTRVRSPDPTVAVFGRLVAHKRVELAIESVAALRSAGHAVRLEIIGEGPARLSLESLAARLGVGAAVTFHGRLDDVEAASVLTRCWLLLQTAAQEGFGLTVLEANALGVPALVTHSVGLVDAVSHGVNGWIATDGNLTATLGSCLDELHDTSTAQITADSAAAWAASFTWGAVSDRLVELFDRERRRLAAGKERRTPTDTAVTIPIASEHPELRRSDAHDTRLGLATISGDRDGVAALLARVERSSAVRDRG